MILVFGGSGSGKSEFAETLITKLAAERGLKLYYLATMKVYGEEDEKKIEKHRRMRAGKGFVTIEQQNDICRAMYKMRKYAANNTDRDNEIDPANQGRNNEIDFHVIYKTKKAAVLLECVSNLTANEMFKEGGVAALWDVAEKIPRDISALNKNCGELVIVSDDVFEDGLNYDPATKAYAAALGKINCALAKLSDEVFEIVAGIPIRIKS